jgi:hypothetical protein
MGHVKRRTVGNHRASGLGFDLDKPGPTKLPFQLCSGVTGRRWVSVRRSPGRLRRSHVINSGRTLQVCIHGPQGTIGCTPFLPVSPGGTLSITWSPNSNEPAGDYCANTWRANSGGAPPTEIGHYCVNVHA